MEGTQPTKRARRRHRHRYPSRRPYRRPTFTKKNFYKMVDAGAFCSFEDAMFYLQNVIEKGTETENKKAWEIFRYLFFDCFLGSGDTSTPDQ